VPPPVLYSLMYYAVFMVYPLLGTYVLFLNSKATMNRIFFFICLSLTIWAITFSLGVAAPDFETSLFWRRVSSLGWGTIYAILFHFFLYLTKGKMLTRVKWVYALIYLPVLFNLFVYGIYSPLAVQHYELVFTGGGWINIATGSMWDWYFNLYYTLFSLGVLWLLLSWGKSSKDKGVKKTALIMGFSLFVTIGTGTITDIIESALPVFPDIGVIIALVPSLALLYTVKKHGFLMPKKENKVTKVGEILSGSKRKELYQVLSLFFLISSLLNLVHYFYFPVVLNQVIMFSALLFIMAIMFRIILYIPLSTLYRDNLMIVMLAFAIPLIMLHFMNSYAVNNIWPFPLLFITLAAIYNNKKMIIVIFTAALLTQLWVWNTVPVLTVRVAGADHLLRLVVFVIGAALALFLNRTYVDRLKENEEQIKFQKMSARVSTEFVSVTESNLDSKISLMLEQSGKYFQAGMTYLLLFSKDYYYIIYSHEWCEAGKNPIINHTNSIPAGTFRWWLNNLKGQRLVYLPYIGQLPAEARTVRDFLISRGIKSFCAVPLYAKERIVGIWGFDALDKPEQLANDYKEQVSVLANLLADALQKVESEKEIQKMAYYDELTGLPNRVLFNHYLEKAISMAKRNRNYIGILFLDLDSFKHVNDTMGHNRGDLLLQHVARRITGNMRKHDTVCRFGGDEFLIMFPQMEQPEDILQAANKIMSSFEEPITISDQEIFVTASGGVSVYPADGKNGESLIKNADLAMYHAKKMGRNQFAFCSTGMKQDVQKSTQLTNQLYRAHERGELVLHYQPQVSIVTKRIVGMEALIRWQHPDQGLISPDIFIPLAEKTGLINPIGEWVLNSACRQSKCWQKQGLAQLRMAVNLSVVQLRKPGFVKTVEKILHDTGLEPQYLELEITESDIIRGTKYTLSVLNDLKALGVGISIDDFGTEYSSLSRLKELPVDRLKIDMQFVQGIELSKKDKAITAVIVSLGRSLGLKVTAEGVETEEQLKFLELEKCDELQGFYFYKPMPVDKIEQVIRSVDTC